MKKIGFISIIILMIANTVMAHTDKTDELVDIVNVMKESNLSIDRWEVTLKEKLSQTKLEKIVDRFNKDYEVKKQENKDSVIYEIELNNSQIIQVLQAIFPKNKYYSPELVVVLHGENWNETIHSSYLKNIKQLKDFYFTKNVTKFSCVSTIDNAIIDNDKLLLNLTEKFKMKHIEKQKDNVNTNRKTEIIYAYSDLWDKKITIKDKLLNLQMVIQNKSKNDVQLIIGTPILINEY